jgi:hypothetical protein
MRTFTDQTTKLSFGTYFVHLFEVNADRFQLLADRPALDRDCEYRNCSYELSDLMRQANVAGARPREY